MKRYHAYLDKLRASGKVNMYAAGAELERKFGLTREQARFVLLGWMESTEFAKPLPRKKEWKTR